MDPQGHDKELMNWSAHSLVIDGKAYPIQPVQKFVKNGWFNSFYSLNSAQVKRILAATNVGVTVQLAYGAPLMLGFDSMPFAEGREKFVGLLNLCDGKM